MKFIGGNSKCKLKKDECLVAMNILLTNDDGIYARGLWVLYRVLAMRHHVTVVAPDRERSAVGHGITLHEPLRAVQIEVNGGYKGYAVNGTPVDCIKLGLTEITEKGQDLVISGINPGENVGVNLNYSGTVAAAKEASLYGLPAISISVRGCGGEYYKDAARFAGALAKNVLERGLPFGTILNVNVPDIPLEHIAGVRISRQGISLLSESFEKRVDPRNRPYYWSGPDSQAFGPNPEVDGSALSDNYISITPIKCDNTNYRFIEDLMTWGIEV